MVSVELYLGDCSEPFQLRNYEHIPDLLFFERSQCNYSMYRGAK